MPVKLMTVKLIESTGTGDPKSSSGAAPNGAPFSIPDRGRAGSIVNNKVPDAAPAGLVVSRGASNSSSGGECEDLWSQTASASASPSVEVPPQILPSMATTNPPPAVNELRPAANGQPGFMAKVSDPGASSLDSDLALAAAASSGIKIDDAVPTRTSAGLHIKLIADANNVNARAGWAATIQQAASIIEQNFSDPVTINLRYGYGSFRNVVDPNLNGASSAYANTDRGRTLEIIIP